MDPKIIQKREEFKRYLSQLNNYLWGAGLKDPVSRIHQISYLFFLKMLEEQDLAVEQEARLTKRKHQTIFSGEKEKFRWSNWIHKSGMSLYKFVRDEVFPFAEELHNGHTSVGQIFHGARFMIPDEVTLRRTIDIIDKINLSGLDTDIKGDLYEDLLNQIEAAGALGQFLTPRHIVRAIVEMINPQIGDTIMDPACGTGGFLLMAYEYIKLKNSDRNLIEKHNAHEVGPGDKLTKAQWDFLQNKTFFGRDVDQEMARMALMNLFLHGLEASDIKRKDTIAGADKEDDLRKYVIILTNPPFAGKVDKERIKKTLPIKSKKSQILFLGYVIDSLKVGGRAAIILPEGTLFGTNKDDKEIRRYLLENTELQAVISMPAGVFQPYAGVKTSFLIFKKKSEPKLVESEKIWFFNMQGDGSSLSAAKKFGLQYKNDIPKLLKLWSKGQAAIKPYSWFTAVKEIAENDYILSANTYSPYNGEEEVNHRDPKDILDEVEIEKKKLETVLNGIKRLL